MAIHIATDGTGTEFSGGLRAELLGERRGAPARHRARTSSPGGGCAATSVALAFGGLFLLIVVLCLLAPVYSHDIAHIGPDDENITGTVKVGGKPRTSSA